MKLTTYECQGRESWGFVVEGSASGETRVYSPAELVRRIKASISSTGPAWLDRPSFRDEWPGDLTAFLALEDGAMRELADLERYLRARLAGGADAVPLLQAGIALADVKVLAPIPRPRIYFGLVQNGTSFIRNNPLRANANLFPQGHDRPQGSVAGPSDVVVHRRGSSRWGYNIELGVVIGKKGRYIPAHLAMEHVAGYLPVMDVSDDGFYKLVVEGTGSSRKDMDWFLDAMTSWCGKMADTLGPMGPYLVTRDEVPNVYDLLVYTRQNGVQRDRAHTGCHLLGVERLIQWYSSFATLYPGDVLHLGTMGVDGLLCDMDMPFGPEDTIEVEIEKLGCLRTPVVMMDGKDWREARDPSRTVHPSPAVRRLMADGKEKLAVGDWTPSQARHYWTLYANYRDCQAVEGIAVSPFPRVLNTPASSLGPSGSEVEVPPRATTLDIGIEFAAVIGRIVCGIGEKDAAGAIAGYTALISLSDRSFADAILEPATPQERSLPVVYGRWADGFNVVSATPAPQDPSALMGRPMRLEVEDFEGVSGSTGEYVLDFTKVLSFLSRYVTLFPGDVVTLGRIAARVAVPAHVAVNRGLRITAEISGLPRVTARILRDPARRETRIPRQSVVHLEEPSKG